MPEGDTIFRTASVLRAAIAGKPLVDFQTPRLRVAPFPPQTEVRSVEARGKHLLIGFGDGRVLHTHMQMNGSWHVYRPGEPWLRGEHRVRVRIDVPDAVAVCFDAPVVEILRERDLPRHPRLSALGPDLCSPDADLAEASARLERLPPATEVAVALLDQRVASGVGNVYKSEVLFARRVDPFAALGDLDLATKTGLLDTASRMLRANLGGGRRSTAPGGLAVYGKTGRPCPRCATPIRSARQGQTPRATYWCPSCQCASALEGTPR
jgi:endonuclease VIII